MKRYFILLLCLVPVALAARPWSPGTYPNPMVDLTKCGRRGVQSWVCDPDGLISYESANVVEGILKQILTGNSPYALGPCGPGYRGYQVAVALMRRMKYSGDASAAAQQFAKFLHDRWGVGDPSCNNGVLLFLSAEDRQVYISTGTGATSRLTFDVLGDIIEDMRPALKDGRYGDAVERGVIDIGLALAGRPVEPERSKGSGWDDLLGLAIFGSVAGGIMLYAARTESRKRRRYQDCKSKLEKLKRDQAAMRANTYNPTSCPVCLEDFTDLSGNSNNNSNGAGGNSGASAGSGSGAASAPDAGAGCGGCGDACGGKKGESVERKASLGQDEEAELRRPLVGQGSGGAGAPAGGGGVEMTDSAGAAVGSGSAAAGGARAAPVTRRPLVLPCGHAFCESCITQWLEQKKVTCPICRKPFDEDDSPDPTPRPPRPPTSAAPPRPGADPFSSTSGGAGPSSSSGPRPPCSVDDDGMGESYYDPRFGPAFASAPRWGSGVGVGVGPAGAAPHLRLRWGARRRGFMPAALQEEMLLAEMMFRLRQLQMQHPDYITPTMLHSWEQDLQNGREFNSQQLRDFQMRDPATRQALAHSGSQGASVSFGGGSGSGGGGRSGSW